jgi:hypothetical protein
VVAAAEGARRLRQVQVGEALLVVAAVAALSRRLIR